MKRLKNLRKNTNTLGFECARSLHIKYKNSQNFLFLKLVSTCADEQLHRFIWKIQYFRFFWSSCHKCLSAPQVCQNLLLCNRRKINFVSTFGFWTKTIWTFAGNFPAGLPELHCTCPDEHFEENFFKTLNFYNYSPTVKKTRTFEVNFWEGYHYCVLLAQKNISKKKSFCKNLTFPKHYRKLSGKNLNSWQKKNVKTKFSVSKGSFWGFLFLKKILFS